MIVRIGKQDVDVLDRLCKDRPCLQVGQDKGAYTPGVGYTNYHAKPRLVCWTRFIDGCPTPSVCPVCRTLSVLAPGERCNACYDVRREGRWQQVRCEGVLVAYTQGQGQG